MISSPQFLFSLPVFAKRLIAGRKIQIDNQVLNVDSQLLLNQYYKILGGKISDSTPQKARKMVDGVVALSYNEGKINNLCDVQNNTIKCNSTELPIRIYRPKNNTNKLPTLIYYHGGGFVLGTLQMYDYLCATFSSKCNIQVISIDYRLAPEHKFPIPVTDSILAYNMLYDNAGDYNIDINQLGISGDSAGGNLATVVTSDAMKNNRTPRFQLLIYPVVRENESKSFDLFKEGFLLETDDMHWFANHYVHEDTNRKDPLLSPFYSDNLDMMPPTIIVVAGFDPLRDEGLEYAAKLKSNGVEVTLQNHPDQFHGFYHMNDVLPGASLAVDKTCKSIKQLF